MTDSQTSKTRLKLKLMPGDSLVDKFQILAFPGTGKTTLTKKYPRRYIDIDQVLVDALPEDELPWVVEDFKSWKSDQRVLDAVASLPPELILLTHTEMPGYITLGSYIAPLARILSDKVDDIAKAPSLERVYREGHASAKNAGATELKEDEYLEDVVPDLLRLHQLIEEV